MNDSINITGDFFLQVFEDGKLVDTIDEKNMIVVVGRGQLSHLLAGDVTGRAIANIGFGENTAIAAGTDTALTNAFTKAVGAITYPTPTSVQFAYTLATTEANGKQITEFGLLCTDGTLFSRKQRSLINKTSSISLVGTWTINL